jgi:hypothetical protein
MAETLPIKLGEDLPAIFDRDADRAIPDRVLAWVGSDGGAELRRPLATAERKTLERRVGSLQRALVPWSKADRNLLEGEISLMFSGFPSMQKLDDVAATGLVAQHLQSVRPYPFWAVSKACRLVRTGQAGLPLQYCPSEPEFNAVVRRLVSDYERRLVEAQRLLDAKVQKPPAPKQTREEIEVRLGHSLGPRASSEAQPAPVPAGDGKHAERVFAELAARKARRAPSEAE